MEAARNGEGEQVKLMLQRGAKVNAKSKACQPLYHGTPLRDKTAFMFAAENGHIEIVQALLDHGADIHVQDSMGDTAWMLATENEQLEVMQLLWKHSGQTVPQKQVIFALWEAARHGHEEMVRFLVDKVHNPAHLVRESIKGDVVD